MTYVWTDAHCLIRLAVHQFLFMPFGKIAVKYFPTSPG